MPGFVTHYIFGREAYHKLDSNMQKNIICFNRGAYNLGLQGPDIFFYYLPSYAFHSNNIGAVAHTKETRAFFNGLLQSCCRFKNQIDFDIAEAYLTGFLGHYTLDAICHPYIYAMTHYNGKSNDYFSRHAYLETDIDTALLDLKLHRRPCDFNSANTIVLTRREKHVIASMLHDAFHYAFPALKLHRFTMQSGIFSIQLGMRILKDNSGQKKVFSRFCEKHFLGFPVFSPLVPSDTLFFRTDPFNMRRAVWQNPWDKSLSSKETFFDLYDKSSKLYQERIKKLHRLLHCNVSRQRQDELIHEFLMEHGNLSFHSGLNVSIPS